MASEDQAIAEILQFIDAGKHRPLCLPPGRNGEQG
jgi:UDP-N-acetylglucosamine acyltransferase